MNINISTYTKPLINIFRINSNLINNCFKDVKEEFVQKSISNNNNFIQIAIHILDARYYIAELLGLKNTFRFREMFSKADKLNNIKPLPSTKEILSEINNTTDLIISKLLVFEEKNLKKNISHNFPYVESTLLGAITFLIQHESYHVGQLGYIRRYLGMDSVKYTYSGQN
jgi:uncharacterized damage-inducible protein DinB